MVRPGPSTSTRPCSAPAWSLWHAAVAAGASPFEEPSTFVTGDRFGSLLDPFGHRWAILTRVEDVSPEEAERRVNEWMAEQQQPA